MKKRISFLLTCFVLSLPSLALADYRIAYSADGNQHDPDDWHASVMALAMLAESGNKWRLVHFDYNNHLGDNNWKMAQQHKDNVLGAVQRYGYEAWRFFDDQSNLGGSVASIARAINQASWSNRLYLICAGPMEVCYRGIKAANDANEKFVTVVSHSWWNENHNDTWQLSKRWIDIQRDFDVQTVEIADQNQTAFRSSAWAWDWLKQQNHGPWLYQAVAQNISGGDASDAGMMYYVLNGRTSASQWATMSNIKAMFSSTTPDSSGGGSDGGSSGGGSSDGGSSGGITPPSAAVGLKARNSGKCAEITNWSKADGANIRQWACSGNGNQKWRLEPAWGGRYVLRSQYSGKCLEVAGKSWSNGANVDQWNCHKGPHQQFTLVPKGDGWFNLKAFHSNKCVTVANGATWNGANLQQWDCHTGGNQQFRFDWSK